MRHRYTDQNLSPAAMLLPVKIWSGGREGEWAVTGKLDTAADMTAIPRDLPGPEGVPRFATRRIRQTGRVESTYLVEVELDGQVYSIEAVGHGATYALIGRDILNELKLIADGPAEVFELVHRAR